ncbi:LANO_0D02190g1_1 [Lachancea nothofagi CBS 11611]|uniref:LANO_0D02190g1_1 n=1 Tax=Lachancea nothofagi CBS 11611 TaxID=1266666 RepID=A0A1G4JE33_9SACH|nr:LANO_0D02190g1_1 [Lachancea nothofagi CBS 11611]
MDPELQIKALVDTLAPRTAHQYKLYHTKYLQWCRDMKLVRSGVADHPYKDVIVTSTLVHWFILSNFVCVDDSQFSVSVLRKMISAFKFLHRICKAYEPDYPYELDYDYLESVARLHVSASAEVAPISPLNMISVHMWSPHGKQFSEKYFKGGIEKLRFLVDFHVQQYWHLAFADRSQIKLGDLRLSEDHNMLLVDRSSKDRPSMVQKSALLRQTIPWNCPLVTLAAYLHLRFYGTAKLYKGDGFPNLLESDEWCFLPLVRGKSLDKYPREETMTNYYADVFRHCHLPYKRREYFYNKSVEYCQYPTVRRVELEELQDLGKGEDLFFPQSIPVDFLRHMNKQPVYEPVRAPDMQDFSDIPESLLVQIFPEVEEYKRNASNLNNESRHFLAVMELLRYSLVAALPLIKHFFPEHDLFRDSMFQSAEFQGFCQQKIEELRAKDQLEIYQPESLGFNNNEFEPFSQSQPATVNSQKSHIELPPANTDTESLHTYLRDQTFRMVQYQTATNFHLLLQSLSRVFEKLETKKSNREFILHQLGSLEQTLQDRISKTSPDDIKKEDDSKGLSSSDTMDPTKPETVPKNASRNPAALDSDAEDDDDYKEDDEQDEDADDVDPNLQNELQTLVSQVMDVKFQNALESHTKQLETHVHGLIAAQVKEEVRKQLTHLIKQDSQSPTPQPLEQLAPPKRLREDSEPPLQSSEMQFGMTPQLESIEDVVLEWFTPNPDQGNECVHTMNRKYGKGWRTESSDTMSLYKQRKVIVEFYICLVNQRRMDRYKAVAVCENLRGSEPLALFSEKLKEWKRDHNNTFDGLG